jgi:nucleoside 2-deoxyribosyltransferase
VVEELNFTLVFQEKTEPKDTIHEDIWENVKGCKLIICDLTHSRPNCFIEFGYALGLDRPMICVVEESEGKDLEGRLKVPFDCNNKSFSFWKKEWVDKPEKYKKAIAEFRDKLKDRIQQKLAILEAQSEI